MAHSVTFHSGYMSRAWEPKEILLDARMALAGVDYDTLVGTGLSGAIVVPELARSLRKHALIVRKPGDGSHSWYPVEGTLGERWVFVDDFIDSGETRDRVRSTIKNMVAQHNEAYDEQRRTGYIDPLDNRIHPTYVGDFLYNSGRFEAAGGSNVV